MLDGVEYKEVNISGKTNGYYAAIAVLYGDRCGGCHSRTGDNVVAIFEGASL